MNNSIISKVAIGTKNGDENREKYSEQPWLVIITFSQPWVKFVV